MVIPILTSIVTQPLPCYLPGTIVSKHRWRCRIARISPSKQQMVLQSVRSAEIFHIDQLTEILTGSQATHMRKRFHYLDNLTSSSSNLTYYTIKALEASASDLFPRNPLYTWMSLYIFLGRGGCDPFFPPTPRFSFSFIPDRHVGVIATTWTVG